MKFSEISNRLRMLIIGILCFLFLVPSYAMNKICTQDSFKFEGDKQVHMMYSVAIGASSRAVIADPWTAFGVSLLPGLSREMFNANSCFSKEDMAYNIIGSAIGVYTTHWVLTPNKVVYKIQF
jgi:hypothetical protein